LFCFVLKIKSDENIPLAWRQLYSSKPPPKSVSKQQFRKDLLKFIVDAQLLEEIPSTRVRKVIDQTLSNAGLDYNSVFKKN